MSECKFKPGDRVRVVNPEPVDISNGFRVGQELTVKHIAGPYAFLEGQRGVEFEEAGYFILEKDLELVEETVENDPVNHPSHYTAFGAEVIDITEHLSFNRGNAIKYAARAGLKDPATEVQDLKKARWYIDREIALVGKRLGL